jgi:hypothetical protein
VVIGHEADNPTTLTACEWLDVFVDQQRQVRQAVPRDGVWHLEVDHPGMYEFHLRRWPAESGLALTDAAGATRVVDGEYVAGRRLPIAAARLRIAGREYVASAAKGALSIRFALPLEAGPCEMQATFLDEGGKDICGAYYVTVEGGTP